MFGADLSIKLLTLGLMTTTTCECVIWRSLCAIAGSGTFMTALCVFEFLGEYRTLIADDQLLGPVYLIAFIFFPLTLFLLVLSAIVIPNRVRLGFTYQASFPCLDHNQYLDHRIGIK